jgi:phospholipid/cholesterol/gamma-HCH transport system substrate-binding protein
MPPSKKVGWSQLRVGVMAMIALMLVAVLIFLMTGAESPFTDKSTIYTYLSDSAAMTEGSAVRLNGILIGKVKKIELSGSKDRSRTIRMSLQVEHQYLAMIPEDSLIAFSAENVLGAKFLNIKRGESPTTVKHEGELRARDEKDFLEVVQSAMPLLESMQYCGQHGENHNGRESGARHHRQAALRRGSLQRPSPHSLAGRRHRRGT